MIVCDWLKKYASWEYKTCHPGSLNSGKFIVSRWVFCKLRKDFGFFCSVNHFSEGGVNANHSVTCSPSLAKNDSRLLKNSEGNSDGVWIFCPRSEADIALFMQVTRMRKILKIWKANLTSQLLPETRWSQSNEPWHPKQTKLIEIHQSWSTNNDLLNSAKKHVFPKRSTKMINRKEKPKMCNTQCVSHYSSFVLSRCFLSAYNRTEHSQSFFIC